MINRFALILSGLMLLPSAAGAASYLAKPVTPAAAATRITVRDIIWKCGPAACRGATEYGRPVVLCQALARRVGRLESFTVDGRILPAPALVECNSMASGGPAAAAARN